MKLYALVFLFILRISQWISLLMIKPWAWLCWLFIHFRPASVSYKMQIEQSSSVAFQSHCYAAFWIAKPDSITLPMSTEYICPRVGTATGIGKGVRGSSKTLVRFYLGWLLIILNWTNLSMFDLPFWVPTVWPGTFSNIPRKLRNIQRMDLKGLLSLPLFWSSLIMIPTSIFYFDF